MKVLISQPVHAKWAVASWHLLQNLHVLVLFNSSTEAPALMRMKKDWICSLMKMLLWLITAVNILWSTAECRGPVLHRVGGGKYTWAPNMNLTAWAMHEKFYVGDWLYFGFDKTRYNVLEVSKMNYNNCDDKNFITNITRGGRDVFNLTEARPYYFLSGLGYCFDGMKVAVHAQYAPPDPAPLVVRNGCPSQSAGYCIIVMLLALFTSCAVMDVKM